MRVVELIEMKYERPITTVCASIVCVKRYCYISFPKDLGAAFLNVKNNKGIKVKNVVVYGKLHAYFFDAGGEAAETCLKVKGQILSKSFG